MDDCVQELKKPYKIGYAERAMTAARGTLFAKAPSFLVILSFFFAFPLPTRRRSVLKTHEQAASADDVEDLMTGDHAADAAALKEMMADPLRAPVEPGHARVSWLTVCPPSPAPRLASPHPAEPRTLPCPLGRDDR